MTYTVISLYYYNGKHVTVYQPNEVDIVTFLQWSGLNKHLYIDVQAQLDVISLDFSKMMVDHNLMDCTSWDMLGDTLTDALVDSFKTNLPGFLPGKNHPDPDRMLKVWNAMDAIKLVDLNLGDSVANDYGNVFKSGAYPDLRCSLQLDAAGYIDLPACLPIVSGCCCYPEYHNDALYALDGAKMCYHLNDRHTPEVNLLDLSGFGGYAAHHFDGTKYTFEPNTKDSSLWVVRSKDPIFYDRTAVLSVGGVLVWPDQYRIVNAYTLHVELNKLPLTSVVAWQAYCRSKPIADSSFVYGHKSLSEYLQEEVASKVSTTTFLILLPTLGVYVRRFETDQWNIYWQNQQADETGVILSKASGLICTYVAQELNGFNEIISNQYDPLYQVDAASDVNQTLITNPTCDHHHFTDIWNTGKIVLQVFH